MWPSSPKQISAPAVAVPGEINRKQIMQNQDVIFFHITKTAQLNLRNINKK